MLIFNSLKQNQGFLIRVAKIRLFSETIIKTLFHETSYSDCSINIYNIHKIQSIRHL